ncbi:MAG: mechanosensitive ion channel [Paludibacteraceae bacterium]|nr:mechanosensitive ion channel [Paludibacteraceae bacterium]
MLLQVDLPQPQINPADSLKQVTEAMLTQLQQDPETFWHTAIDNMIAFGLKVLAALLIYIVGSWLIGKIKKILQRAFTRRNTEQTIASFATSAVTISLTVMLVIITVSTLGVDTTSLAALLAAGGMAIGMALSGTVQNFAGGIMLLVFKPFKAGDWIEAQGIAGTVMEVNITATKILTVDNRVIILPNGSLSNGTIDNFSARPLRRIEWIVSVAYGSDAEAFRKTIFSLLADDKRVLQADTDVNILYNEFKEKDYQLTTVGYKMPSIPAPEVFLKSLNDNDISFTIRAWVRGKDYWDVYFKMYEVFYTELPKNGFEFAYPHVDVTMLKTAE